MDPAHLQRGLKEEFPPDEEYYRQCGDIFVTIRGELLIHCSLCETRYKSYQKYAEHIAKEHNPYNQQFEEFQILSDKENDVFAISDYNVLEDIDEKYEIPYWDYPEILDSEENRDIKLETFEDAVKGEVIFDDFMIEKDCSLDSIQDKPIVQPFKYRFRVKANKPTEKIKKRKYNCAQCDFSCADKSNLVGHIQRHSAFKPHQCFQCPKAFYTRSELQTHIRSHTGERPYLCPDCGCGFSTSSKLTMHTKKHASPDQECTFCDKKFYSVSSLKRHMTVHSDVRPFRCTLCDSTFKLIRGLKSHLKSHENKREYKCDLCPADFNQKCNLNTHRKTFHGTSASSKGLISFNIENSEFP